MTQIAYAANEIFPVFEPRSWLHPVGFGTLGFALPAGIGAKFGCPGKPVAVMIGHYGIQYTINELGTAAEHKLPPVILMWNNDALAQIRNDVEIITEILESHFGRSPSPGERQAVIRAYLSHLANGIDAGRLKPSPIAGAESLLDDLAGTLKLGIATANLLEAASLRLAACAIWEPVKNCAFGAKGGGAKRQILARAMADLALPPDRIIFIGDNLNDVEAGLANGVHFIGF